MVTHTFLTQQEILNGNLQKWQIEFLLSKANVRILSCARQIGKSLISRTAVVQHALDNPNQTILYLAGTHNQAYQVGYRPLAEAYDSILDPRHVRAFNKSSLTIEFNNGSRIIFRGTEPISLEKLRGFSAHLVVLDEYAIMPAEVMTVIQPILSATMGKTIVLATPKGLNHFYDIVQKGIPGSLTFEKGHRSWMVPITEADIPFKEERIEQAKSILSKEAFDQEYMLSFQALVGKVYKGYDVTLNSSDKQLDPEKPLFIGLDFNVAMMHAVVCQIYMEGGRPVPHVVDEIALKNADTQMMTDEINRRYKVWKEKNKIINIYPDASGAARKTSALGNTDHTILQRGGLTLQTLSKNPIISDRINAVNAKFCNAKGVRELFVSPRCSYLVKSLSSQAYDAKTNAPEKGSGLNDLSGPVDALGYFINKEYPINKSYGFSYNI